MKVFSLFQNVQQNLSSLFTNNSDDTVIITNASAKHSQETRA